MGRIRRNFVEWVANFGLECSLSLSQLVLSGVFDRHPGLKLFFAETRLGWVPFWLESADLWYQRHLTWAQEYLGFKPLKQLPSEYIKQHILWSIQYERVPLEIRHRLNVDHIMFASDFPHIECEWPNSRQTLDRVYTDIPEDEKQKIWAGNAVRFFKLDQPAESRVAASGATA
jgi:predicted TIM-barrel fold metal-dependent hydrolase